MNLRVRKAMTVLALGVIATQFVNCSETSETYGNSLYGKNCAASSSCNVDLTPTLTGAFMTPRAETTRMECTHDHLQIGGACETDGAVDSYIEYSLTQNGAPTPWIGNVTVLHEARCENGRFFLIVPRPLNSVTSANCSGDCSYEYHLNSRLWTLKKGAAQFEVAAIAPLLPISIQLLVNSGSCPR